MTRLRDGRQTLLFSATLPASLADVAGAGLSSPTLVRLDAERKLSPDLGLAFFTGVCWYVEALGQWGLGLGWRAYTVFVSLSFDCWRLRKKIGLGLGASGRTKVVGDDACPSGSKRTQHHQDGGVVGVHLA